MSFVSLWIDTFARRIFVNAINIKGLVLREKIDSKTDAYSLTRYNYGIAAT